MNLQQDYVGDYMSALECTSATVEVTNGQVKITASQPAPRTMGKWHNITITPDGVITAEEEARDYAGASGMHEIKPISLSLETEQEVREAAKQLVLQHSQGDSVFTCGFAGVIALAVEKQNKANHASSPPRS